MGRRFYPRTVVEEAPSHDGRPCYAAWEMSEADPNTQTPPDASNRPKWSIQLYDTTPTAAERTYIRAVAKQVEESTREARRRREAQSRVEVHGLPLPAGIPDAERAALCAERLGRRGLTSSSRRPLTPGGSTASSDLEK
ncbi:hypothetical protein CPLU01_11626 [Colletotrichum plurivorum]|uniref:Uncharacterized protein n=1 Tax=Colletotrichum plurivorum TaxID=2175906 RepID=A0A8H6K1M5_9PEZI|nr:hypothetical protein CPLU01_11626 [Colletotrichum plurivorum]